LREPESPFVTLIKTSEMMQAVSRLYPVKGVLSVLIAPRQNKVFLLCRREAESDVRRILGSALEEVKQTRNGLLLIKGKY
jgi:hypothetical protein